MDEPLLEVSTDKVDTEIPSPVAGILQKIVVEVDQTVLVGSELAVIAQESESAIVTTPPLPAEPIASYGVIEKVVPPVQLVVPPVVATPPTPGTVVSMPALGESVSEGTVTRWLKNVGDTIVADEPLLEVSTDKVDTEIPSPVSGTLLSIDVPVDATVPVGARLALIGVSGAVAATTSAPLIPAAPVAQPAPIAPIMPTPESVASSADIYVTPLVRKLASDLAVDLSKVVGTGVGGRIRREDVEMAVVPVTPTIVAPVAPTAVPISASPATQANKFVEASPLRGQTVKMSRLRKVIAARMVESLHVSAQLTTVIEVDVTKIARLRDKAKANFESREGVKLSFMPFFAVAVCEALKQHPVVNSSVEGDQITYHAAEHLAIAVDTERGLLVPVIHDAGNLNMGGIARKIADLAARTRDSKVSPEELGGGTFTITNTGSRGALFDTPIINQPQVAILGLGAIVKRPVVVNSEDGGETIAIRSMVYLALSYDHRVVDGADAARFLVTLKGRLEGGAFEGDLGL
jgi:2-oxoglutarate dehydrogenase E2 component (dihydrolipoamide succinyltransferase)